MKPDLSVKIGRIVLKNPVMNAAGTMEPNEACQELIKPDKLGAIVPKSINFAGKSGSPQPRLWEVAGGIINNIGLQNDGVINFVEEKIFEFVKIGVPLIVSFFGKNIREYLKVARILQEKAEAFIAGLEANVSCPNIHDGLIFGSNAKLLFKLVKAVKAEVSLPLIVKLTPNVTDIGAMAKAAEDGGADILSLINTFKSRDRIPSGPNAGQWIVGGYSGFGIKPIALQKIFEVSEAVDLPLIGMGGILTVKDALDFLRIENVWAVGVGTATFRDPSKMVEIIAGLGKYLKEKGYKSIKEFKRAETLIV